MRQEGWQVTPERDEVGWAIGSRHWGRGLATEAARAAIVDGFDRVGLARILSWTLPENVASRRVMEKCGLSFRGNAPWADRDHVWYAIERPVEPAGTRSGAT